MQIVIDIDDNLYTRLFDNGNEYVADMRRACVAIRKGTPLPKGHGRLIDADKFDVISYQHTSDDFDNGVMWLAEQIGSALTIIEADKESEDS